MKLRKILAASAVVAVMTTALAVSAMADVTSFASTTLDYVDTNSDNVKDSVTITYADTNPEKPSAGPYTILIVKRTGTEGETELATPTGDTTTTVDGVTTTVPGNIKQIDESTTAFTSVTVGELGEGTYEVRIGGDGTVRWGTFTVEAAGSEDDTQKVLVGDVNGDGNITSSDATEILCATVDLESCIDKTELNDAYYAAAYCNGDSAVTSSDATEVLCATVDLDHNANIGTEIAIGSIE